MIGSERLVAAARARRAASATEFAEALRAARTRSWAPRPCAPTRSCTTISASSARVASPTSPSSTAVYDRVLELGPAPDRRALVHAARAGRRPVGDRVRVRRGHLPPADWDALGRADRRARRHLVERYGIEEVSRWGFEVWNEPNLEVFWTGSRRSTSASTTWRHGRSKTSTRASRRRPGDRRGRLDHRLPRLRGRHGRAAGLPLHAHVRQPAARRRRGAARARLDDVAVWWTEWGVTPTHFLPVNDSVLSATFLLHGIKSAQGRADALAYWVVSDHFEELGRPPALLHGGFGLQTVGGLRKPRWWALALAQELGDTLLPLELEGDGAGSLVDGWAARDDDGTLDVLLWNGTLDQSKLTAPRCSTASYASCSRGCRPAATRPACREWTSCTPTSPRAGRARRHGRHRTSSPRCRPVTSCTTSRSGRSTRPAGVSSSRSRCRCRGSRACGFGRCSRDPASGRCPGERRLGREARGWPRRPLHGGWYRLTAISAVRTTHPPAVARLAGHSDRQDDTSPKSAPPAGTPTLLPSRSWPGR